MPKETCPPRPRFASTSCHSMNCWLILAIVLTLAMIAVAPQALSVVLNKLLLLSLAAWLGYWLHVSAFRYVRPGDLLALIDHANPHGAPLTEWDRMIARLAMTSIMSRAIVMGAAMLAIAIGI
jgi:Putative 2/3 transmembrane domain holin